MRSINLLTDAITFTREQRRPENSISLSMMAPI